MRSTSYLLVAALACSLLLAGGELSAQEVTVRLEYQVIVRDAQLWETPAAAKPLRPLRRKEKLVLLDAVGPWLKVQARRDAAVGYVDAQAVVPTKRTRKKWGTPVFWKYPRRRYLPPEEMSRTELIVGVVYELEGLFWDGVQVDETVLMSKALYAYYQQDFITASLYLALSIDRLLDTHRIGRTRFGSKRTYELLEATDYEVSPPVFRVQVEGRWHRFEIRGNTIRRLD